LRHPYLAFQHELCISCGRCVRACDEVQGAFALTATGRGFTANIAAGLDSGFLESTCVSCGACADSCPTDAITEIALLDGGQLPAVDAGPRLRKRLGSHQR
jgi:predicted molibdopterin-dependent oxidoreductase YjgC